MLYTLWGILVYVLFPVVAMILGGILASFRAPGPKLSSALQHFAAGTVFAAVAVELLPDVVRKRAPISTVIGFSFGVVVMLTLRWLTSRFESQKQAAGSECIGLVTAVGIDITIDGFLIGISFSAGAKQGILLTIALTLELLSLGLATVTVLRGAGIARGKSIFIMTGLALLVFLGAIVGITLLVGLPGSIQNAILAFGVAALLYLVTEELLVEAHEVPETPPITSIFFVGFLVVLMIDLMT